MEKKQFDPKAFLNVKELTTQESSSLRGGTDNVVKVRERQKTVKVTVKRDDVVSEWDID